MSKESAEKLQTVRGVGGQLLGFSFWAVRRYFWRRVLSRERKGEQLEGGIPLTTVRNSGELFGELGAGSFLEGFFSSF